LALPTERAIQQFAVIMLAARIFAHAALKFTGPRTMREARPQTDYIAPDGLSAKKATRRV
jgi:hypothetical protein